MIWFEHGAVARQCIAQLCTFTLDSHGPCRQPSHEAHLWSADDGSILDSTKHMHTYMQTVICTRTAVLQSD